MFKRQGTAEITMQQAMPTLKKHAVATCNMYAFFADLPSQAVLDLLCSYGKYNLHYNHV